MADDTSPVADSLSPRAPGGVLRPLLSCVVVAGSLLLVWQGEALALIPVAAGLALLLEPVMKRAAAPEATERQAPSPLLERLLPIWSAQLDAAQADLGSGMAELLEGFQGMLAAQEQLEATLQAQGSATDAARASLLDVSRCGERAMHALQTGDRVHQLIDVIRQDQQRLLAELPGLEQMDMAAAERWLRELEARYTTDEQHRVHAGDKLGENVSSVQYF